LIPESVADELRHADAPEGVRRWVDTPPSWLRIRPAVGDPAPLALQELDAGERDAILLAVHLRADLLLMDDREGVDAARHLGLTTTGTLGVLVRAAERGVIDLSAAIGACETRTSVSILFCSNGSRAPCGSGKRSLHGARDG
jgi:predicted nucleic acid-binding protein